VRKECTKKVGEMFPMDGIQHVEKESSKFKIALVSTAEKLCGRATGKR
jgi:hypothetical protein